MAGSKKFLTTDNLTVFLFNLIPIFGVLYWHWQPILVVMLYIAETLLIGLLHIFYMGALYLMNRKNPEAVNLERDNGNMKGGCIIPFFIFHYGFFVGIQMVVFSGFNNKLPFWDVFMQIFTGSYKYALLTLFVIKITAMISEFLWDPNVKLKLPEDVFFQPYARIFVQQFMVILGGWFVILGAKNFLGYLIVLVVAKTFFEILFQNMNSEMLKSMFNKKGQKLSEE